MFDKLKSIFIVSDDEFKKNAGKSAGKATPTPKSTPPPKTPTSKPVNSNTSSSEPISGTASAGKVTDKFMDILLGAMEKNNIDGFDYLEYKHSMESLSKMDMDEATRYRSAFAMAQTMGATPQRLIDTAQHYMNVLKKEEQKFQQALVSQKGKQIGSKEQRIKDLGTMVKQKQAQIEKLQQEMEAHKKEAHQLKSEISNASVKVETTKNNFTVTYDVIISQIARDVENMKNYLK